MPGVGLQLLPMTAPESSPWVAARSHSHALLHLPRRNSRLRVLRLGGDLVSFALAVSTVLVFSVSGPAVRCSQPCATSKGRPGTIPAWADGQMTSVGHAVHAADASVSYALAGLGRGAWVF